MTENYGMHWFLASNLKASIYFTAEEEFEELCFDYGLELDEVVCFPWAEFEITLKRHCDGSLY